MAGGQTKRRSSARRQCRVAERAEITESRALDRCFPLWDVNGNKLLARGKWLRRAFVRGEEMMETELGNPKVYIEKLRGDAKDVLNADIFTFTQKLPATSPRYAYPLEWESVAAIRLSGFSAWWEGLPQETRKNVRRSRNAVWSWRSRKTSLTTSSFRAIREVNDDTAGDRGQETHITAKAQEETRKLYGEFLGRCMTSAPIPTTD